MKIINTYFVLICILALFSGCNLGGGNTPSGDKTQDEGGAKNTGNKANTSEPRKTKKPILSPELAILGLDAQDLDKLKEYHTPGAVPERIGFGAHGVIFSLGPDKVIKLALKKEGLEEEFINLEKLTKTGAVPNVYLPGVFTFGENEFDAEGKPKVIKYGLVMERGKEDLLDALEKGPISDETLVKTAETMSKLCDALKVENIKYNDIKPNNLLIMQDGSIKAIDIGASGETGGYSGSCGKKMAISLMEARIGEGQIFNLKEAGTGKDLLSNAYEKYASRVFYKKIKDESADISSIENLSDLLTKLGSDKARLFNKLLYKNDKLLGLLNDFEEPDALEVLKKIFSPDAFEGGVDLEHQTIDDWKKAWNDLQDSVFKEIVSDNTVFSPALKAALLKLYEMK